MIPNRPRMILTIALLAVATTAAGIGTDTVVLVNGDRLTGEIKKLERGKLRFKTEATETIDIYWIRVAHLTSDQQFDIELDDGRRFLGSLESAAEPGHTLIRGEEVALTIVNGAIVRVSPIEKQVSERFDGAIDLGFSYTKAKDATQATVGSDLAYRTPSRMFTGEFGAIFSTQKGVERTFRADLNFEYQRFLPNRWYIAGLGRFQRNEELGLDMRTLVGFGGGRYLVQTNRTQFTLFGGVSINRENYAEKGSDGGNAEAIAGLEYSRFVFGEKESDLTVNLALYPGLTTWGRLRAEFDMRLRHEIITDFFVGISFYGSHDSDPPTDDAEKTDYGVVTSIGWKY